MKQISVKRAAMYANLKSRACGKCDVRISADKQACKVCMRAFNEGFTKGAAWEKRKLPAIGVVINGQVHKPARDYRLRKDVNPCDVCSLKSWCASVIDTRGDDTHVCDTVVGYEGFHFEKL